MILRYQISLPNKNYRHSVKMIKSIIGKCSSMSFCEKFMIIDVNNETADCKFINLIS